MIDLIENLIAEEFYRKLYCSNQNEDQAQGLENCADLDLPEVTVDEIRKALKGFTRNKA